MTTNLALYRWIEPSGLSFFRKTHLLEIGLNPLGKSTNSQVWLDIIDSSSSLTALFQKLASIDLIASSKVLGSSSNRKIWAIGSEMKSKSFISEIKEVIKSGPKEVSTLCLLLLLGSKSISWEDLAVMLEKLDKIFSILVSAFNLYFKTQLHF